MQSTRVVQLDDLKMSFDRSLNYLNSTSSLLLVSMHSIQFVINVVANHLACRSSLLLGYPGIKTFSHGASMILILHYTKLYRLELSRSLATSAASLLSCQLVKYIWQTVIRKIQVYDSNHEATICRTRILFARL